MSMSDHTMCSADRPAPTVSEYSAPCIVEIGSVVELTQGGSPFLPITSDKTYTISSITY